MKVGQDDWCPDCFEWVPFNENGKCKKCGRFINTKIKGHRLIDVLGLDLKEISPNRNRW